jgi:hypothetical protein
MSGPQELAVREKQEMTKQEEKTIPGRFFVPAADIFETDEALTVIMEMPGVEKKDVNIALEDDVLRVEGQIDFSKYQGMEPVYTEYIVGHYGSTAIPLVPLERRSTKGRPSVVDRSARHAFRPEGPDSGIKLDQPDWANCIIKMVSLIPK